MRTPFWQVRSRLKGNVDQPEKSIGQMNLPSSLKILRIQNKVKNHIVLIFGFTPATFQSNQMVHEPPLHMTSSAVKIISRIVR